MPDYDNTPPETRALSSPADNTAPAAIALANVTPDNTAPTGIAVNLAPDNTPPASRDLSVPADNLAPDAKALPGFAPDNTPPDAAATGNFISSNAAAVPITGGQAALPTMPASFQPAFTELTGAGPSLASLTASAADVGKVLQGTVNGELKSYQVRAHAGVQDLPGLVLPANFDAVNNPVAFFQAGL